jgi:hypothetical protein
MEFQSIKNVTSGKSFSQPALVFPLLSQPISCLNYKISQFVSSLNNLVPGYTLKSCP